MDEKWRDQCIAMAVKSPAQDTIENLQCELKMNVRKRNTKIITELKNF